MMSVDQYLSDRRHESVTDIRVFQDVDRAAMRQCFDGGLIKIDARLRGHELPSINEIADGAINWWSLEEHYPRIATIGDAVIRCADGKARPIVESVKYETQQAVHVDSAISHGITLLLPLRGADATFYYGGSKFAHYEDADSSIVYGVGDVLVLRQAIETIDGRVPEVPMRRPWHVGVAEGTRDLLAIDLHAEHWRLPEGTVES